MRNPNIEHGGMGVVMRALVRCTGCAFIYPGPGSDISEIGKIVWLRARHHRVHCLSHAPSLRFAMGKHLTAHELDSMQAWKMQGVSTIDMYRRLQRARSTGGEMDPTWRPPEGRYVASPTSVEGWRLVAASASSARRMCAR